jgi:hypothetical protein
LDYIYIYIYRSHLHVHLVPTYITTIRLHGKVFIMHNRFALSFSVTFIYRRYLCKGQNMKAVELPCRQDGALYSLGSETSYTDFTQSLNKHAEAVYKILALLALL